MNKRGFTIVELLAVVTLLGVLALISIPAIDKTIEKNRQKLYEAQIKTIKAGAKKFAEENLDVLPKKSGDITNLELRDLKFNKSVMVDIKNPKTDKCFYNNMNIIIKKISNNFEFIVDENSGFESDDDCSIDTIYANILLFGQTNMKINVNDEFIDPGYYIINVDKDMLNECLKIIIKDENGIVVNSIDTSSKKTYTIEYSFIIDSLDVNIVKNRKVIIDDQYQEKLLNGATPIISDGMIPVTIENDGTVKKANTATEWYSYGKQKWANMVLVKDDVRDTYLNANSNSVISQTDILGYFVWIPRYKYKIPTSGTTTPSSIDIVFQNKNNKKLNGNARTEYFTPPGFTFGSEELNGIWVAKFETTGTATIPTSLPNVSSLRSQTISDQFETAQKFANYGITRDPHMMKNTEWATVAYLSHSKYGINTEIRINNNKNYITGCGATNDGASESSTCQIKYGNNISNLPQSTTGNITGIFDMSGGARDSVMGNYNKLILNSNFVRLPEKKYYDLYDNDDYLYACNGKSCIGHDLLETYRWYTNYANSINPTNSWIYRGGAYDQKSAGGIFSYSNSPGGAYGGFSFRTVIV